MILGTTGGELELIPHPADAPVHLPTDAHERSTSVLLEQYHAVPIHQLEPMIAQLTRVNRALHQAIAERERAERRIAEQLEELRRWHHATLGSEGRVLELKREVNGLLADLGRPPRYTSVADGGEG